ncbi:MAG TPA: alpha-(1-_3)-arabinofuranosyltransferase family protein [Streptosporangiaceae bacterium]|nr:alpha-(1->3)-arabinofuranosyltransferase family protein [Streptosporangiaceae bacterium]
MSLRTSTVLVWFVTLVILLFNAPGRIFFDTKLGVDIDPITFFARLWQLWNASEWFGTLQDQYIGYGFPMGPFYLGAHLLQVPVWVTERLWLSVLVAVGFTGIVKLARELGIGTRRSTAVAGLAFALWPTVTIVIGSTSAGLLPGLLAPWAVLPLAKAARGGPVLGAAARSGVAVLCMGGVNATSTLDALILPVLYILTQARGGQLLRLAACWAGAVALATSWWVVPLLLQAKYSFNFLPYIEQAATTTGTMSAATFLRGAGNWTAYLSLGQPWLSAGWFMVTNPVAILAGAIAAGTGLLGLARRDLPYGGWLRLCLGLAALVALAGYPGPLGGLFHGQVDQMLNGVLAPLRSVYKVEPAAAAVLALGIAHALVLRARRAAIIADPSSRIVWHLFAAPAVGLVLVGLAFPYLSGQVLNPGSFESVPGYWYQVAGYIRQHSPDTPVLVAPAAAHGTYLWGETVDDPLEPLATSPWVTQGLVPYGGAGSQLLLDSVEGAIASGERTPGLAATLARSGIRYIVVRNDLNPSALGYTAPQIVHQALGSSGFRRVAAFGPLITGKQTNPGAPQIQYALPSYPAVEVWQANPSIAALATSPAVALPVRSTVLVDGGPDALLQLTEQRILSWQPAVIAGDRLVARPALWAVTDSLPRADHAFGGINSTPSYTYAATETNPPDDPLGGGGGPPRQLLPVASAGHQTVAVLTGARSVIASSAGFWLAETPQISPVNAFDHNPGTFWAEASPDTPVGQWIQVNLGHRVSLLGSIGIRLLVDGSLRPVATRLTVTTAAGTLTSPVRRTSALQSLPVPPGATKTLRITIAAASGQVPGGPGAGFTDIEVPGVKVTSFEAPAQSPAGQRASAAAFSFRRQVPSPASLADLSQYPPLARAFATARTGTYRFRATAIAVPGKKLDALLARLTPSLRHTLEVTASSTLGSLPDLEPQSLFQPGRSGSWIAGAPNPVLRLGWQGKRTIRRMVILPVPGFSAVPRSIKITSPNGTRFASVGLDGLTEIVPPLTTQRMTISFPVVQFTGTTQQSSGQPVQLPVGLSKLSIPALNGLRAATPAAGSRFSLGCGTGPRLTIDGRKYLTEVAGTIGDLTQFHEVRVRLCSPGSGLVLRAGRHRVRQAARPGPFTLTDLSLVTPAAKAPVLSDGPVPARPVQVLDWGADSRRVRIGAGPRSYLEVHQNANPGWVATLGGRSLTPVTLDGWQQGFVVPAGPGGTISLTFRPVKFYHAWIILSAIGAIALLLIASARLWRRRVHEAMVQALSGSAPASLPAGGAEPGPAPGPGHGPGPGEPGVPAHGRPAGHDQAAARSRLAARAGFVALCALLLIAGGPVAVAVPLLALLAARWPTRYGALAFACMIVSGLLAAMVANPAATGSGAFGAAAQACALVALAAALIPAGLELPRLAGRRAGKR